MFRVYSGGKSIKKKSIEEIVLYGINKLRNKLL